MSAVAVWIAARPWVKFAAPVVLAVMILIGIVVVFDRGAKRLANEARTAGAQTERASQNQETLNHVRQANEAAARYRNDAAVRNADCLRDATNPAEC